MKKIIFFLLLVFVANFHQCFATEIQSNLQFQQSDGKAFNNHYVKQNLYSFNELIYSKQTSFGGSFNVAKINSPNNNVERYALFGPESFHRYKFFSKNNFGLVVQNDFKLPNVYNPEKNMALMPNKNQYDYEIRLIQLYNFKDRLIGNVVRKSTPYFFRTELAYRQRFHNPFNEIKLNLIGNYALSDSFQVLVQDNINWNVQTANHKQNHLNNTYKNFEVAKTANNMLNLSLIYNHSTETAYQLGYTKRLSGNNPFYDSYSVNLGIMKLW